MQLEDSNVIVLPCKASAQVKKLNGSVDGGAYAKRHLRNFALASVLLLLMQAFTPFQLVACAAVCQTSTEKSVSEPPTLVAQASDNLPRTSDELTKQILLDEIALEKFNLNYRLESGKVDRWKGTRYFLLQEANIAMLDAGFIATVAERTKHINSHAKVNLVTLEHALIPRIVGPFLAVGSSLLELGIDSWHDHDLVKSGFSPSMAKEHVIALRAEIDRLLKEREIAVKSEQSDPDSTSSKIQAAEGDVLKDARDLSLAEFERFHIGAKKYSVLEKSLYALNAGTMGMLAPAEILPLVATYKRDASIDAPAAILAITVGGLFMATPIIGRSLAKLAGDRDRRSLQAVSGDVLNRDMSKMDADRERLKQLCQSAGVSGPESGAAVRLAHYETQSKHFRDRLETAANEIRAGRRVATQNYISGAIVGGTVIGSESAILVAALDYPTNGRRLNVLADAGSIGLTSCLSYAFLDNLRIHTQTEWNRHKLSRKGMLPGQALQKRLKELDEIEANLKKSSVVQ